MEKVSCSNPVNQAYFQCINDKNNMPSARQLGIQQLKPLVPQFYNIGRFDVARHGNDFYGVRYDSIPADVRRMYFNVGPSESFGTYSKWA